MHHQYIKILILMAFSSILLAENEATFDPVSGVVNIPQVILLGDPDNRRFDVKLQINNHSDFTVIQANQTSASVDTQVEKYISYDSKEGGRLVYGQALRRIYPTNSLATSAPANSLPYYVTEYVQGLEVRIYKSDNKTHAVAKSVTDRNGFYQAIVSYGKYNICFGATNDYCSSFTLSDAQSQRCNFNDLSGGIKPSVYCQA